MNPLAQQSEPATLLSLRREWPGLAAPDLDDLVGDLEASFVAPLRRVAPAGLGLIGLPRWFGKRFHREGDHLAGMNLLRSEDEDALAETLPMTARVEPSLLDGRPAVAVSYAPDAPVPWRWVRDEIRLRPDGSYLGMTLVQRPVLRMLGGTPFLLRSAASRG
ncbi:hypothetical protein [Nocardioides campestrisoli]|uniref:hypothetical protein n=1 Tax=Nocardioides campestrisoli TaxID=2736757 RepID=UPI0015E6EE9F|nr:hypothetical protein [Nocardioides campestrisoli]